MEVKSTVFIRADGSLKIGVGHLVRCSALAYMLKDNFLITFFCKEIPQALASEFKIAGFCLKEIETEEEFFQVLNPNQIVVLDGYGFDTNYQRKVKEKGSLLVCIDDFCDKHYVCDALINNIPGYIESEFSREQYTKLYLGTDYALLRNEFLNSGWRMVKKEKKNVFVSFGGSDYYNLTWKICSFLKKINPGLKINVLIGPAYQHINSLSEFKNATIYQNVSAKIVASLIAKAEICIIPASSLLNEVACVGSNAIIGYFVTNQIKPYNYFVENQLALGIGNLLSINLDAFNTTFCLAQKSENILKNQYKSYRHQQTQNLKNIFLSL